MDPVDLEPAARRALLRRTADAVADHLDGVRGIPPITLGDAETLAGRLGGPLPEAPGSLDSALEDALHALAHMQHGDHPRQFGRIAGPSSVTGIAAELLAAGHNAIVSSWAGASGPVTVELATLRWLAEMLGLDPDSDGVFLSGGSVAILTAIAHARLQRLGAHDPDAVVYLSDQAHASVPRALRILGFAADRVRILPTGPGFALDAPQTAAAVAQDRAAGRRPFALIATAGTTNTGAIDPIAALAQLAAAEDLWLHVDGAWGVPAAITPEGRDLLAGLDRADTLNLDPHKWLFTPYEAGVLLARRPGSLKESFELGGEYLADMRGAVNMFDRGPQLTRSFRALKLWLTLRTFGAAELRAGVARSIALAGLLAGMLERSGWEIVTVPSLAIVTFAHPLLDDAGHRALVGAMQAEGFATLGSTTLRGRTVLRACTVNPRTTDEDVEETVSRLTRLAGGQ